MTFFLSLKRYLVEATAELKKVVWPTKKQTINYTFLVFLMCVGMAVFFAGLDYLFSTGLEAIIRS